MPGFDLFCERCGTRYRSDGTPATSRASVSLPTRVLNAVGRGNSAAVIDPESLLRLCLSCRGYSCPACWNEEAGFCQTCAPLPEPIALDVPSIDDRPAEGRPRAHVDVVAVEPAPAEVRTLIPAETPAPIPAEAPTPSPVEAPAPSPAEAPTLAQAEAPTLAQAEAPDVTSAAAPPTEVERPSPTPEVEVQPAGAPEPQQALPPTAPAPAVEPAAEEPVVTKPPKFIPPEVSLPDVSPPRAPEASRIDVPAPFAMEADLGAAPPAFVIAQERDRAHLPAAPMRATAGYETPAPPAIRPCPKCQLMLSARAHYCRRCGTAQV